MRCRVVRLARFTPLALLCSILGCRTTDHLGFQWPDRAPGFVGLTNLSIFNPSTNATSGVVVLMSPPWATSFAWDELIPSWNVSMPEKSLLEVEVRVWVSAEASK